MLSHFSPSLCSPPDCSPPGASVHMILQTRILEWVAMPSSSGDLPNQGIEPASPVLKMDSLPTDPPGKPALDYRGAKSPRLQQPWIQHRIPWEEGTSVETKLYQGEFPGGSVVKDLSCNTGDVGLTPGWGTKVPHAMEQLSLHTTTTESMCYNERS